MSVFGPDVVAAYDEISALRERLAAAEQRATDAEARAERLAAAAVKDITRIVGEMQQYVDGWRGTLQRNRLATADPMIDLCRPISDWAFHLECLATILPLALTAPATDTGTPD